MLDKIQTYGVDSTLVAMTKQEFFAQAEKRIRDSAGSGFEEWGNHNKANGQVNEGMYEILSVPNQLSLGRSDSSKGGISRTTYPIALTNGVAQAIREVNTASNTGSSIKFPDAPDGTKTYDSATGIVTSHASAAEAFEGLVTNGDFRNGLTNYGSNGATIQADGSIAIANSGFVTAAAGYACPVTAGDKVRIEITLSGKLTYRVSWTASSSQSFYEGEILTGDGKVHTHVVEVDVPVGSPDDDGDIQVIFLGRDDNNTVIHSHSLMPATEQVITSRKDFVFLEVFHEEVSLDAGVDGNKDEVYYKGMVQSGKTNPYGITSTTRDDGYTRFGEWDSVTTGQRVIWSTMNFIERNEFLQDPENNFYRDGDKLIQVRGRIRVLEGKGDDWLRILPHELTDNTTQTLQYDGKTVIAARGSIVSIGDYSTNAGNGFGNSANSGTFNLLGSIDVGVGVSLDGRDNSHNDMALMIPIALVQRRNQGAYHPAYNPEGASRVNQVGGGANAWYGTITYKPATTSDCFTSLMNHGQGSIGFGYSGRSDGKYYDAIYASDVEDLRMSSRRVPVAEIREHYKRKAIAGTVRGHEGVPFSNVFVAGETTSLTTTPYSLKLVESKVLGDTSWMGSSNTPCAGNVILSGVVHKITHAKVAGGDVFLVAPTFAAGGEAGSQVLQAAVGQVSLHKQANPTWTDIVGDPARIAATFPNGVEGTWIPAIPTNGSAPFTDFPLSRKSLDSNVLRTRTFDNGSSWSSGSSVVNTIQNTVNDNGASLIALYHYETQAHFTEDGSNSKVLDLGSAFAGTSYLVNNGNLLTSSLIGKVQTKSGTDSLPFTQPVRGYYLNDTGILNNNTDRAPTHDAISLSAGDAVKSLDYLSEEDGVAKLCYAYKEMKFDTDENTTNITVVTNGDTTEVLKDEKVRLEGFNVITNAVWIRRAVSTTNRVIDDAYFGTMIEEPDGNLYVGTTMYWERSTHGWGDDNQFNIGNNQSTMTDDNGNSVLFGTASFNTQFFIDRSSGAL